MLQLFEMYSPAFEENLDENLQVKVEYFVTQSIVSNYMNCYTHHEHLIIPSNCLRTTATDKWSLLKKHH